MIIETKNKTINLVLKTRKIVDIANLLKNKNFEEVFIKAYCITYYFVCLSAKKGCPLSQ